MLRILTILILAGLAPRAAAADLKGQLELARYGVEHSLFNVIFAKEVCSCLFVDGLNFDECKARDNLPAQVHQIVDVNVDKAAKTVTAKFKSGIGAILKALDPTGSVIQPGPPASAKLVSPELGCILTSGPAG